MRRKTVTLAALAVLLLGVLGMTVGKAYAYFTTYATARGGYTIELGSWTEIQEEFSNWTKHITISSREDSQPVYVRARAYAGSDYTLIYEADGSWTAGDEGWYYYGPVVNGGDTTSVLDVRIENVPEGEDPDDFNVVVVYETTPVQYREDGTPYADWSLRMEGGDEE